MQFVDPAVLSAIPVSLHIAQFSCNDDKDATAAAAAAKGTRDQRAVASPTRPRPGKDDGLWESGAAASSARPTAAAAAGAAAAAEASAGATATRVRVEQLDALLYAVYLLSSLSFAYLSGNYHTRKSDKVTNKAPNSNSKNDKLNIYNYLLDAQV